MRPTPRATPDTSRSPSRWLPARRRERVIAVRYLAAQPPISSIPVGRAGHRPGGLAPASLRVVAVAASEPANRLAERQFALLRALGSRASGLGRPLPARPELGDPHDGGAPRGRRDLRRQAVLVVLPSITWWGLDPGDEDGDGVPDTLLDGSSVQLARPLVAGLPPGIGDEAGLLAYLDRDPPVLRADH